MRRCTSRTPANKHNDQHNGTSAGGLAMRVRTICQGETATTSAAPNAANSFSDRRRASAYTHGAASAPASAYVSLASDGASPASDTPGSDGGTVLGPVSSDSAAPQG